MPSYKSATVLVGSPEYHQITFGLLTGLLYLMFNLATSCSYRCRKCALGGTGRQNYGSTLTSEERTRVITRASEAGTKTLVIIGNGEPTENFAAIAATISAAHENGMGTIMFTTCNNLDREQAEFYATHNVTIIVSLDSLEYQTYRWLTGNGDLARVVSHIALLREVYNHHPAKQIGDKRTLRLGINTTTSVQNVAELDRIRTFADDDMQFVANPPMRRGRLQNGKRWARMISEYEALRNAAETVSSTGGHSSLTDGVCGYFSRGVSVDIDGEFLSCGYAGETARHLGNARDAKPVDFTATNRRAQIAFSKFNSEIGHTPSCPVRDPSFDRFVKQL